MIALFKMYLGKLAPCCEAAHLSMQSSITASSKSGLTGVLNYLQSNFRWGLVQQQFYCECLKTRYLSCGAGAAIACWALEFYRDKVRSIHDDRNFSIVSVLMIRQNSYENSKLWRDELIEKMENCHNDSSHISSHNWICDSCVLHECVGYINHETRELSVWDYGSWVRLQSAVNATGAMISIRIVPHFKIDDPLRVIWDGMELELGKWINLPSEVNPLSIPAQTSLLSDAYSHKLKLSTEGASSRPLIIYISGVEMG
jgi:hypothetical protein